MKGEHKGPVLKKCALLFHCEYRNDFFSPPSSCCTLMSEIGLETISHVTSRAMRIRTSVQYIYFMIGIRSFNNM